MVRPQALLTALASRQHVALGSPPGAVWLARWAAITFGVLQIVFFDTSSNHWNGHRTWALLALAPLLIINITEWHIGQRLNKTQSRQWSFLQIATDLTVTVIMGALYAADPSADIWVLIALPILHAAFQFELAGALWTWAVGSLAHTIVATWATRKHGILWHWEDSIYRAGVLLIVAGATGSMAHLLFRRMEQIDALQAVASVTQRMTTMNPSTLVDEVTRASGGVGFRSVRVYVKSGDRGNWSLAPGSTPTLETFEDPAAVHTWCRELASRISHRNRPMFMRPQDGLVSLRHLDWQNVQVLVAPVRSGNDLFALITATHPDPVPGYRLKTLMLLASHAGAALANARRYSERERYEQQLAHQATHDALTGLPNRVLLTERVTSALRRTRDVDVRTAVLLLDLDRFKEINDTLGHAYGDALLVQVADRLAATMRTGDVAARLGGDEFAVLATGLTDVEDAIAMARRVLAGVHQPFNADGVTLDVEVSIGVAVSPDHGENVEDLLRCADVAMYSAKRNKLGVCIYDERDDEHTPKRLALLGDMRRALDVDDQLLLYYQPSVHVQTGQLLGVEALLRWDHPIHGLVGPGEFVPGAEGTGLIHQLSNYVLQRALKQATAWRQQGLNIPIAVNLSTRCLLDLELPDQVALALHQHNLPATSLRLEITESSIMADPQRALDVLQRIDALGVALSIDDFGTGYSSMTYLKHLPVDELKIDQSFVRGMHTQHKDEHLVRSLIELGHNLGLKVLAEGVETAESLAQLRDFGCDSAQGYFIAQPMPGDKLVAWAEQNAVELNDAVQNSAEQTATE